MQTLSAVIVAKNEERIVGKTLAAIKDLADEIVFVDSGSTDSTIEIAKSFSKLKLIHQDWLGYAAQKNFAMQQAQYDWVLSLDADEVVTEDLSKEIKLILDSPTCQGYKIPRILYIGDRAVTRGGFFPDAQLRLIRRGAGQFNDRLVHEAIKMEGTIGMLRSPMLHYAYATVDDFAAAMENYARLSAKEFARQGRFGWKAHPLNEMIHPMWTFLYRYLFRGGILDGAMGFRLNTIYSDYVRKKIRYLRELSGENNSR